MLIKYNENINKNTFAHIFLILINKKKHMVFLFLDLLRGRLE